MTTNSKDIDSRQEQSLLGTTGESHILSLNTPSLNDSGPRGFSMKIWTRAPRDTGDLVQVSSTCRLDSFHSIRTQADSGVQGRRVCVGYSVAVDNLSLAIARMVYCFDFEQDPNSPIDTSKLFGTGPTPPFRVLITPRSDLHRRLIEMQCSGAAMSLNVSHEECAI